MRIAPRSNGSRTASVATASLVVVLSAALASCGAPGRILDGNSASPGTRGYCVDFADAIGLYAGNPVTQMGFRVGEVTNVESRGQTVRVTFALREGRDYPAATRAITRSKSLLADRSIEHVDNYTGGDTLKPGTCIPAERTYVPKSISEIAGSSADFVESLSNSGDASVQRAVTGLDKSLAGTGPVAASMYQRAAAAAQNPEQVTADIGSSIMNMAPLTDAALKNWSSIQSMMDQLPEVATKAVDLSVYVQKFVAGIGWLIMTLYDVNQRYGGVLWPLLNTGGVNVVKLLASRAPDLQKLYSMVPGIAKYVQREQAAGRDLTPTVHGTVKLTESQCRQLNVPCNGAPQDIAGLLIAKVN